MVILQYQLERNEVNFDFLRGGEILEKVIKYRCSECGELFDTPEKALAHEIRHRNKIRRLTPGGRKLECRYERKK